MDKTVQRRVFVSGKVQGVGYRASVLRECRKYDDIRGFVRNLGDGRVEAVFVGPEKEVLSLVNWCMTGPSGSKVTAVEIKEEAVDPGLNRFQIEN